MPEIIKGIIVALIFSKCDRIKFPFWKLLTIFALNTRHNKTGTLWRNNEEEWSSSKFFVFMRIIAIGNLKEFYEEHPDAETGIKVWINQVKSNDWGSPKDIMQTFRLARPIGNGRVIFNINKNDYRLIVKVEYRLRIVFVCFIGTHGEYDKIDPETVRRY